MLEQPGGADLPTGASVVFGFRIQAFFARCPVVGVRGIRQGEPEVVVRASAIQSPTTWLKRSGSSHIGQWPERSKTTSSPGIRSASHSPLATGMSFSSRPQARSVGSW